MGLPPFLFYFITGFTLWSMQEPSVLRLPRFQLH